MSIKNNIKKKIHVIKNLSWKWVWRYSKKKLILHILFYFSIIKGKKFWEVNIDGVKCKLSFFHPYHHLFARHLYKGEQERILLSLWKKQVENIGNGVVFDIGAYNGIYGLIAGIANPQAKVVIFEPDPINLKHIQDNIELNNLQNVTVVRAAVSDQSGVVSFKQHAGATAGVIQPAKTNNGQIEVPSISLNDWVKQNNQLPVLMKFDIGGIESTALLAASEMLAKADNLKILLEFYMQSEEKDRRFWDFIHQLGFQSLYLYPREDGVSTYYFVFKNL